MVRESEYKEGYQIKNVDSMREATRVVESTEVWGKWLHGAIG